MSSIFGGSEQKSYSQSTSTGTNRAFPLLQNGVFGPAKGAYKSSLYRMDQELDGGFGEFKNKMGYDFFEKMGLDQIAGNRAGQSAFQSGAALKELAKFQNEYSKGAYGQYLGALGQQNQAGLGGLQALVGAGGQTKSTSRGTSSGNSNNGAGSFIGAGLSLAALSDRSAKTDIEKVGTISGTELNIYNYRYKTDEEGTVRTGVMADEVAKHLPEALGPKTDEGYQTVYYDKIEELTGHGF